MHPHAFDFNATRDILSNAVGRLLHDEPLNPFCDWFAQAMGAAAQAVAPVADIHKEEALRYQRYVARLLWGHMPVPSHRWRARGLPKVERNDPCHCGSGRKFKQCCAKFDQEGLPIDKDSLLTLALDAAEPDMLTKDKVHQIPPHSLGTAALQWNEAGRPEQTLMVLTPLFADMKGLDERHELALDALMDAMLMLGQHEARRQFMEHAARHPNKVLATAARCRLVSVLADQGEEAQAWQLFHETSRFNPNDPQLWHLELTLLLTQGRQEEARLRAPLLAARARKANLSGLADAMMQMAEQGLDAARGFMDNDIDDPEDAMWLDLCGTAPEALDVSTLLTLYKVDRFESARDGQTVTTVSFKPVKKLADLERRWRRRFMVGKPELTWLEGDLETLLDDLPEALLFLEQQPMAWLSVEILDDLLLAALYFCDWEAPSTVLKASRRIAHHAMAVLRALVGDGAQLHWVDTANRPLLRCLAVAVELARFAHDEPALEVLLRTGLALNPHDNHGWMAQLSPILIEQGRYQAALDLMAQYPDDFPPSEHLRALALFALGKQTEAEAVLREAHGRYPLFLNALLPDTMDPPPEEAGPGILIGGATAAWHHRVGRRPLWVRSGALAWAQALALPEPALKKPTKRKTAGPLGIQALSKPFGEREENKLRKTCNNYPRLHGLLQAVAWSPQMLMPNAWLSRVMDLHDRMPNSRTEATATKALNDTLRATMQLYNHLNQLVLDHRSKHQPPLEEVLQAVSPSDEAVFNWAAGFVEGCELSLAAWGRAGHKVAGNTGPFGRLRGLAARAPAQGAQGWVQQDNGKPLLLALEDEAPAPPSLVMALTELWPVVRAARHTGS